MPSRKPDLLHAVEPIQGRGVGVPQSSPAIDRLRSACRRAAGCLSVGLEPCRAYLPEGFEPDTDGFERFLMTVVEATADLAAAFKFNLAFFEALGPDGWALLHRVRRRLPAGPMVIADAKRSDIGSSAAFYASALFEGLGADAATVNPLMGRDSVEPFLDHEDRLTFVLVLTSNPGAEDFLQRDGLYRSIAQAVRDWNHAGNCGCVVGATRPEQAAEVRRIVGSAPLLVPGVGAQGGDLNATARHARLSAEWPATLIHVTRGLLPKPDERADALRTIRDLAADWNRKINSAMTAS